MQLSILIFALTSATGAFALNAFTSPVGRQTLTAGEPFVIRWNNNNGGSKIDLFLKKGDSGNLETALEIATDLDNVGAVRWTIPLDIEPSNDYALEIVNKDNLGDVNYTPMFIIAGPNGPPMSSDPPTTAETTTTTSTAYTTSTTEAATTTEPITTRTTITAETIITRNETVTVTTTAPNTTLPTITPSMNVTTFPNTTTTASPTFTNTTAITTPTATTTSVANTIPVIVSGAVVTSYSSLLLASAIAVMSLVFI